MTKNTSKRKITFIGAGSTVFSKNFLVDILSFPELSDSKICLFDIDPERLRTSEIVARRVAQQLRVAPEIEITTDRGHAFDGATYAINMIQVGGYRPCTVTDFEIPKKYGLRQTIADTLGIGGIMRALRTAPVLIAMAREMESRCPDVVHVNYVNPMAMNCWALARATKITTIGLCHSVQHTAGELAADIGIPVSEINYVVAGINHLAFFLKFERNGEDLYPLIRRVIEEGRVPAHNRVRYDMLQRLGYFVTESSEHFSEYVPWYIKRGREDLIERFGIPLDEYPKRCVEQIEGWKRLGEKYRGEEKIEIRKSREYASSIVNSVWTGEPSAIYGNQRNDGSIASLPEDCAAEVACRVDAAGLHPTEVGALPPQLTALIRTNINV